MSRAVVRLLMAATGVAMLVVYGVLAALVYQVALALWAARPDPVTFALAVTALSLTFGYASYRLGTARILSGLDARELSRARAPGLYDRVDAMAEELGVEPPRLLVARMGAPNALALGGPGDGDLVVAESLFSLLDGDELLAILAHELAHIESRDSLVKTLGYSLVTTLTGTLFVLLLPVLVIGVGLARATGYLLGRHPADVRGTADRVRTAVAGVVVVVAFVFTLALRAYSRRRELAADDRAAELTGNPVALARALRKIQRASDPSGLLSSLYVHGDEEGPLTRLLATHPPMDDRVERLVERAERDVRRIEIQ